MKLSKETVNHVALLLIFLPFIAFFLATGSSDQFAGLAFLFAFPILFLISFFGFVLLVMPGPPDPAKEAAKNNSQIDLNRIATAIGAIVFIAIAGYVLWWIRFS